MSDGKDLRMERLTDRKYELRRKLSRGSSEAIDWRRSAKELNEWPLRGTTQYRIVRHDRRSAVWGNRAA